MAYKFDGGRAVVTYNDSSNEKSSVEIFTTPLNDANILPVLTEVNALVSALEVFQDNEAVRARYVYGETVYGENPTNIPTDAACQREIGLRVYLNDDDGNSTSFVIPCADLGQVQLVQGGGDAVDISVSPWPTISGAFQAGSFVSRYGSPINGIAKVRVIGRNN